MKEFADSHLDGQNRTDETDVATEKGQELLSGRNDLPGYLRVSASRQKGYWSNIPTAIASRAHKICPRTMVKYRGNSPARSHPLKSKQSSRSCEFAHTGIEFELMFVTNVA